MKAVYIETSIASCLTSRPSRDLRAVASVHAMDYLLTWNCRHIDNAATKPIVRSICTVAGYACPEICTPLELLSEEVQDVQG